MYIIHIMESRHNDSALCIVVFALLSLAPSPLALLFTISQRIFTLDFFFFIFQMLQLQLLNCPSSYDSSWIISFSSYSLSLTFLRFFFLFCRITWFVRNKKKKKLSKRTQLCELQVNFKNEANNLERKTVPLFKYRKCEVFLCWNWRVFELGKRKQIRQSHFNRILCLYVRCMRGECLWPDRISIKISWYFIMEIQWFNGGVGFCIVFIFIWKSIHWKTKSLKEFYWIKNFNNLTPYYHNFSSNRLPSEYAILMKFHESYSN